jgi:hypothetical protein
VVAVGAQINACVPAQPVRIGAALQANAVRLAIHGRAQTERLPQRLVRVGVSAEAETFTHDALATCGFDAAIPRPSRSWEECLADLTTGVLHVFGMGSSPPFGFPLWLRRDVLRTNETDQPRTQRRAEGVPSCGGRAERFRNGVKSLGVHKKAPACS